MPTSCVKPAWRLKLIGAWRLFCHPPDCSRDQPVRHLLSAGGYLLAHVGLRIFDISKKSEGSDV
jgi:hypothetical protein